MSLINYLRIRSIDVLFLIAVVFNNQNIYASIFMYFILTIMALLVILEASGLSIIDPAPLGYTTIQKILNHIFWICIATVLLYKQLYFEFALYLITYLSVITKVINHNKS